jgi:hypothetical protein
MRKLSVLSIRSGEILVIDCVEYAIVMLRLAHSFARRLERVDFFIAADELHNLAGDLLGDMLSEARKYHLSLPGATQYLNRLSPAIRSAIFGNVGTRVAFRIGAEDARSLESAFAPHCQPADLQTLGRHEFYVKLAIDGGTTPPFRASSLPPLSP